MTAADSLHSALFSQHVWIPKRTHPTFACNLCSTSATSGEKKTFFFIRKFHRTFLLLVGNTFDFLTVLLWLNIRGKYDKVRIGGKQMIPTLIALKFNQVWALFVFHSLWIRSRLLPVHFQTERDFPRLVWHVVNLEKLLKRGLSYHIIEFKAFRWSLILLARDTRNV